MNFHSTIFSLLYLLSFLCWNPSLLRILAISSLLKQREHGGERHLAATSLDARITGSGDAGDNSQHLVQREGQRRFGLEHEPTPSSRETTASRPVPITPPPYPRVSSLPRCLVATIGRPPPPPPYARCQVVIGPLAMSSSSPSPEIEMDTQQVRIPPSLPSVQNRAPNPLFNLFLFESVLYT